MAVPKLGAWFPLRYAPRKKGELRFWAATNEGGSRIISLSGSSFDRFERTPLMASLHREVDLATSADGIWAKLENPADINKWFTFLGDVTWDEASSTRTCAMGEATLNELIVDVDPGRKRVVYSFVESPFGFDHHSAAMQVVEGANGGSTFIWTHDFTPDEVEPAVQEAIDGAVATILESDG